MMPKTEIFVLMVFVIQWTLLGLLNPLFSLMDILPIARCFLLGGLGFIFAKNNSISNLTNWYYFTFGIFVGDCFNCIYKMDQMIMNMDDNQYAVDINIIFSVMWLLIVIFNKRWTHILFALCLIPIIGFTSVSRGIFSFFIFGLAAAFIIKSRMSIHRIMLPVILTCIIGSIAYFIYYECESIISEISPTLHFRLYTKMNEIGDNESDTTRIAAYIHIINNWTRYLLPRGFLGKSFFVLSDGYYDEMYAWDSAYSELLYTFGFCILIPIYLRILYWGKKLCGFYLNYNEEIYAIIGAMLFIIMYELFFGYGVIRSPFTVISFGIVLGYSFQLYKTSISSQ